MSKWVYSAKLLREFVGFARENKVYWIVPLILILGLAGILMVSTQAATPLMYTLF